MLKKSAILLVLSLSLTGCNTMKAKTASPGKGQDLLTQKTEGKQCVDNFDLLKDLNYSSFQVYRVQFDAINKSHAYFKQNQKLMENDPRELMTITLNDKLNMICDRVKSQTFIEIRKKMQAVGKI